MSIPSIPFVIITISKVGETVRREQRNATTLPQAYDIYEKELRKPLTRICMITMTVEETVRHGGADDHRRTR